ncbi:MAG: 3-oxoacyl-ACP synthase [Verrucomicrobia bacterium CAG:312_58_20]|nr:MAG: 3-oxoacyl-ACP synthase [Verrucomicrobia bacterium CAG:312_58_20]PWL68438.1 MAG: 3-oxoacyl-ACP synthase [Verrucomicrobiota bacterium]
MNSKRPNSIIIKGTGKYVPERIVTNDDLSKIVDTSDEWIFGRSGIKRRRIAADGETTSDMALKASKAAIESAGLTPHDIDLVIVTTVNPDMLFPSTACILQAKLGIRNNIPCFDLEAACSGFVYGMEVATSMMASGRYKNALVVSSEKMSSMLDWKDRSTCVLFGDGSGAVVLAASGEENAGILGNVLGADGSDTAMLCMPAGGSAMPPSERTVREGLHYLKMDGREVFKHAVRIMQEKALEVLDLCGVSAEDVALLIPHQANTRIIETVAKRLKIPSEKVYVNIENYGNTSSASIPIALDEVVRGGKVRKGDLVLLVAFGAGLTWGATLVRF